MTLLSKALHTNMDKAILKILNSEAGRCLIGITDDLPIVRYSPDWVEMWTGQYKNGKPLMKATIWTYPRVAEKILIPQTKLDIALSEYTELDPYKGFLHYSNLEPNFKKYPTIFLTAPFPLNPATGEARLIFNTSSTSWATARAAANAVSSDGVWDVHALGTVNPNIQRTLQPFNTSTIGAMNVSAANYQAFRNDARDGFANNIGTTLDVVPSQMVDPTAAALADYSKLTFTSRGNIALASTTDATTFTITITDFTEITGTAYTKYMMVLGVDVTNTDPGANNNQISCDNRSQTNPPKLNVTYTLAASRAGAYGFII